MHTPFKQKEQFLYKYLLVICLDSLLMKMPYCNWWFNLEKIFFFMPCHAGGRLLDGFCSWCMMMSWIPFQFSSLVIAVKALSIFTLTTWLSSFSDSINLIFLLYVLANSCGLSLRTTVHWYLFKYKKSETSNKNLHFSTHFAHSYNDLTP